LNGCTSRFLSALPLLSHLRGLLAGIVWGNTLSDFSVKTVGLPVCAKRQRSSHFTPKVRLVIVNHSRHTVHCNLRNMKYSYVDIWIITTCSQVYTY
jgi:hypothetical protein